MNIKKLVTITACVLTMLVPCSALAMEGEGTEESPFLITNQEELETIDSFPDCYFKLQNDIILEGEWTPLCLSNNCFTGTLDGSDYTVKNMIIKEWNSNIGFIAQNDGVIKNLNIEINESDIYIEHNRNISTYIGVISSVNNGTILNCRVKASINYTNTYTTYETPAQAFIGGITGQNNGTIEKSYSDTNFNIKMSSTYQTSKDLSTGKISYLKGGMCYIGVISGQNYSNIKQCISKGMIKVDGSSSLYAGGITGSTYNESLIQDSYYMGDMNIYARYNTVGGIVGYGLSNAKIDNSYSSAMYSCTTIDSITIRGIGKGIVNNCFYDKTISNLTDTEYGTPKTTIAMKMKKTYTDVGWDFDNVWGIDANINDGYPYLLWEYPDESSATTEIIGVTATDSTLKFISEVSIGGEPEIAAFGTTFIPLWLFETGSADTATVDYDNSIYNIKDDQTYGATLTDIPESCKNMDIVGKSYIKDKDGIYTWSAAKYSSVNNPTLNAIE